MTSTTRSNELISVAASLLAPSSLDPALDNGAPVPDNAIQAPLQEPKPVTKAEPAAAAPASTLPELAAASPAPSEQTLATSAAVSPDETRVFSTSQATPSLEQLSTQSNQGEPQLLSPQALGGEPVQPIAPPQPAPAAAIRLTSVKGRIMPRAPDQGVQCRAAVRNARAD